MTTKSMPFQRRSVDLSWCVAALLALLVAAPALAQLEEPPKDADHAKRFLELMKKNEFKLRGSPWVQEEMIPFCRRLGADLQTQNWITHIEPIARAETYGDPVFRPFRDRCPGLELNGVLWPADWYEREDTDAWKQMTEAQRDREARASWFKLFGTRNFKMYHLDLDNDPTNGEEYVFHAERFYVLRDKVGENFRYHMLPKSIDWNDLMPPESVDRFGFWGDGKFMVLDLDRCERGDTTYVADPYSVHGIKTLDNFGGIFRYRGKHYVFNVTVNSSNLKNAHDRYEITVESYGGNGRPNPENYLLNTTVFSYICSFKEVRSTDEPKDQAK